MSACIQILAALWRSQRSLFFSPCSFECFPSPSPEPRLGHCAALGCSALGCSAQRLRRRYCRRALRLQNQQALTMEPWRERRGGGEMFCSEAGSREWLGASRGWRREKRTTDGRKDGGMTVAGVRWEERTYGGMGLETITLLCSWQPESHTAAVNKPV